MNIKPPGFYTNGQNSTDALILEARGYLAARYGWTGRTDDIHKTFHGKNFFTPTEMLKQWDEYNNHVEFWREANRNGL